MKINAKRYSFEKSDKQKFLSDMLGKKIILIMLGGKPFSKSQVIPAKTVFAFYNKIAALKGEQIMGDSICTSTSAVRTSIAP